MTLVEDWDAILKKAWSVKCNILATILSGAEVIVAMVHPAAVPNGIFAGLAALVTVAANVTRVMAQQELKTTVAPNAPTITQ